MAFLAKSASQGGTSLLEHTRDVVAAMDVLARGFGFSPDEQKTVRLGSVLHDLGKAHPHFQQMVTTGLNDAARFDAAVPHRHEISSLLLLPAFPETDWPVLVDLVVAHHKSPAGEPPGRGLLDLVLQKYGADLVFERHAERWEEWAGPVLQEVAEPLLGAPLPMVPLDAARRAFDFAIAHCEAKPGGWSRWKGVLMAADHLASQLLEETAERVRPLFSVPDLSYFGARQDPLYPLSLEDAADSRRHTLVVAPTGAGKTDYLLRRCRGRVFYTLPFQASINAMHNRIERALRSYGTPADVRRVHAASRITFGGGEREDIALQRHPGASVKVLTPHQLATVAFGTHGHEAAALDLAGCDVILDEVHVYNGFVQAMVVEIVRALIRLNCRIHIGSATIPSVLRGYLLELLGGTNEVCVVEFDETVLAGFDRHTVYKQEEGDIAGVLREAVGAGERVLIVRNRVDRAQVQYEEVEREFPDVPALLVHSRFRRGDRNRLEQRITDFEQEAGPCVVVATQVLEVSLDISFDRMITEAAPLDAMVQRFGRVNRRRRPPSEHVFRPVHVLAPPSDVRGARPYDKEILDVSFAALPDGDVLHEAALQDKIDGVYPELDLRSISIHVLFADGRYKLRELQHRPRAFFVELLDIDSLSCVRESDAPAYHERHNRQRLEIPVPLSALIERIRRGGLDQIRVGNNPYIVPDAWYSETLGLRIPRDGSIAYHAAIL